MEWDNMDIEMKTGIGYLSVVLNAKNKSFLILDITLKMSLLAKYFFYSYVLRSNTWNYALFEGKRPDLVSS